MATADESPPPFTPGVHGVRYQVGQVQIEDPDRNPISR